MGFKVKALVGAVSAVALAAALSSTVMSSAAMAATQALPSLAEPSLSPDGSEIAFASGGDLWTAPAAGGQARLLVTDPATESRPLYSPDGKSLAFVSTRSGVANIYILTLATGEVRALKSEPFCLLFFKIKVRPRSCRSYPMHMAPLHFNACVGVHTKWPP